MGIFSEGQFDIWKQWYVFDPKKGGWPGSFKKVESIPSNSVVLYYQSGVPYPTRPFSSSQSSKFLLTLHDYSIPVESVVGVINNKGDNKNYYDKVNYLRRKAAKMLAKKELEDIEQVHTCSE